MQKGKPEGEEKGRETKHCVELEGENPKVIRGEGEEDKREGERSGAALLTPTEEMEPRKPSDQAEGEEKKSGEGETKSKCDESVALMKDVNVDRLLPLSQPEFALETCQPISSSLSPPSASFAFPVDTSTQPSLLPNTTLASTEELLRRLLLAEEERDVARRERDEAREEAKKLEGILCDMQEKLRGMLECVSLQMSSVSKGVADTGVPMKEKEKTRIHIAKEEVSEEKEKIKEQKKEGKVQFEKAEEVKKEGTEEVKEVDLLTKEVGKRKQEEKEGGGEEEKAKEAKEADKKEKSENLSVTNLKKSFKKGSSHHNVLEMSKKDKRRTIHVSKVGLHAEICEKQFTKPEKSPKRSASPSKSDDGSVEVGVRAKEKRKHSPSPLNAGGEESKSKSRGKTGKLIQSTVGVQAAHSDVVTPGRGRERSRTVSLENVSFSSASKLSRPDGSALHLDLAEDDVAFSHASVKMSTSKAEEKKERDLRKERRKTVRMDKEKAEEVEKGGREEKKSRRKTVCVAKNSKLLLYENDERESGCADQMVCGSEEIPTPSSAASWQTSSPHLMRMNTAAPTQSEVSPRHQSQQQILAVGQDPSAPSSSSQGSAPQWKKTPSVTSKSPRSGIRSTRPQSSLVDISPLHQKSPSSSAQGKGAAQQDMDALVLPRNSKIPHDPFPCLDAVSFS